MQFPLSCPLVPSGLQLRAGLSVGAAERSREASVWSPGSGNAKRSSLPHAAADFREIRFLEHIETAQRNPCSPSILPSHTHTLSLIAIQESYLTRRNLSGVKSKDYRRQEPQEQCHREKRRRRPISLSPAPHRAVLMGTVRGNHGRAWRPGPQ